MRWLGECAEILGRHSWMIPMVDIGRFGCNDGGGLRKFLTSLMRHIGQVVVEK
jgi:hypothetical protein